MKRDAFVKMVSFVLIATFAASCRPKDDGAEAPALPPGDTLTFFELKEGGKSVEAGAQALSLEGGGVETTIQAAAGEKTNVKLAVLSLGLVTGAVNLALLWPRQFWWGVVSSKPTHDGDAWVWNRTFPLIGWEATLRATLPADKLTTEMKVTGLKAENEKYKNFVWYTGAHGAAAGTWTFYALEITGPVLTVDWTRQATDDKSLTFTNTTTGKEGSGDKITYVIKAKIASMTINDAKDASGQPAEFSVTWHVENGSGKLTKKDGTALCWDTLANGQVDIACPVGAWPQP